jgi:hypothetical protein
MPREPMIDHGDENDPVNEFVPKHVIIARRMIDKITGGRAASLQKIPKNLIIGCGICLVALFFIFANSSSPQKNAVAAPLAVHTNAASMMPVPEMKAAPKTSMLQQLKNDAKKHNKKHHSKR